MESVSLRTHVNDDGTLELRVPTRFSGAEVEVTVVFQLVPPSNLPRRETGSWPEGYFDLTFGSMRDDPISCPPPPDIELRPALH